MSSPSQPSRLRRPKWLWAALVPLLVLGVSWLYVDREPRPPPPTADDLLVQDILARLDRPNDPQGGGTSSFESSLRSVQATAAENRGEDAESLHVYLIALAKRSRGLAGDWRFMVASYEGDVINHSAASRRAWKAGPRSWVYATWEIGMVVKYRHRLIAARTTERRAYVTAADASLAAGETDDALKFYGQALACWDSNQDPRGREKVRSRMKALFWRDSKISAERRENFDSQRKRLP